MKTTLKMVWGLFTEGEREELMLVESRAVYESRAISLLEWVLECPFSYEELKELMVSEGVACAAVQAAELDSLLADFGL